MTRKQRDRAAKTLCYFADKLREFPVKKRTSHLERVVWNEILDKTELAIKEFKPFKYRKYKSS